LDFLYLSVLLLLVFLPENAIMSLSVNSLLSGGNR